MTASPQPTTPKKGTIDCDANASHCDSELLCSHFGRLARLLHNPSSRHRGGQDARALIEEARESIRRLVNAPLDAQIVFTSGATEANNTIINTFVSSGSEAVSSALEHPCVIGPLERAQGRGANVTFVTPKCNGVVDPEAVAAALTPSTTFLSIMAANNETGIVQPVAEVAKLARSIAPKITIHTDAVQLPGKRALSFSELGVDIITLSGHKFGAPAGVGVIVATKHASLEPLVLGGPQEMKLRGGTENVLGIALMGAAADAVIVDSDRPVRMKSFRDQFEALVRAKLREIEINGISCDRLPNTSSIFVPGVRADDLVVALDLSGLLISSGAACSSGKPEPSHVLRAMGQSEDRVRSSVRVSMRATYGDGEIERAAELFIDAIERMRRIHISSRAA